MEIHASLNHQNIVKMLDKGTNGKIITASGQISTDVHYLTMEHISGGLLFSLCHNKGALGEDAGRFFFHQLLCAMDYLHK